MIVSPSRKFIFVHIPKNGGTTIESLFAAHIDPEQDLHISKAAEIEKNLSVVRDRAKDKLKKHIIAPRLRNALPSGQYDEMFSFAFSRNPYSRCFSAYNYIVARAKADERKRAKANAKANAKGEPHDRSHFPVMTFDEVCTDLDSIAAKNGLFRPQTFWLPQTDSVDFVGRLESLSEDLHLIYARLGLPAENLADVPVENRKSAKGAWRSMAPESAASIRKFYAADFERFGYSLDFDADDGAPARVPVEREPYRTAPLTGYRWNAPDGEAHLQRPQRPPRPPRPPKLSEEDQANGMVRAPRPPRPPRPPRGTGDEAPE